MDRRRRYGAKIALPTSMVLRVGKSDIMLTTGYVRYLMATATLVQPAALKIAAPFPAAAVEAILRAELIEAVESEAAISEVALPSTPAAVCSTPFQIDSLVVVAILCAAEPTLGIVLPDSVVRTVDMARSIRPSRSCFRRSRRCGRSTKVASHESCRVAAG